MRNLPSIISDISSLAGMMEEQARELREVAAFFCGGGSAQPLIATGLMEATLAAPIPTPKPVKERNQQAEPKSARGSISGFPTRPLTGEEKAGMLTDWAALNPFLRNKTNRLALSRKWRTSPTQFRAVTQGRGNMERKAGAPQS